ncbi:hypothetical protein PRK78_001940 [Emydomyces testavorans]|uniref:Uncharacterized protein n=1 Tax=Emydomyces testavorans TaxID=2070801 RepID=A0AAF0DES8_9EURO|nr:hypothetical protein PRK78_001940 [Emydomyces testavorans]
MANDIKIKIEPGLNASQTVPGRELVGTSQGNAFDKPPDTWILEELEQFGVIDVENPTRPDLEGPIHLIFQRENWPELEGKSDRYDSFKPSFILATKLLKVAGPFLASLIPDLRFDSKKQYIAVSENPTKDELQKCFERLDVIAQHTEWRENSTMWTSLGRHALTVPQDAGIMPDQPVRDDEDVECWERSTKRDNAEGLPCRRMTVYLASQFGDALMRYRGMEPPTMRHSQVVFMCAIALVHEFAHVAYAARFSNKPWKGEPLIQDEVLPELGASLVGWLFKGWLPENISIDPDGSEDHSFKYGCCWYKQRRKPKAYPRYTTVHSMPMSHIRAILNQKEWEGFDEHDISSYSSKVRTLLLRPSLPFRAGTTARIAKKAKRFRVDESPSLAAYFNIWDYHDPDWGKPNAHLSKKELPDSPFNRCSKSEAGVKHVHYDQCDRRLPRSPSTANRAMDISEKIPELATSSAINLWSIPSASESSSPSRIQELREPCEKAESANGSKSSDKQMKYKSQIAAKQELQSSFSSSARTMRASARQQRSNCPSPPSFSRMAKRKRHEHSITHDSVENKHSQLGVEQNSIMQNESQSFVIIHVPMSVHVSNPRRSARRSRRLRGLEPELLGLQETKRQRVVRHGSSQYLA